MRKHTYYTYVILKKIKGFEQIATWAAYHHEKLNGKGYPFHVKGENFSKLARIVAVADIVTAITEDRPYRLGMSSEKAIEILSRMVENSEIDNGIVGLVKDNFALINNVRIKAQQDALQEYNDFYHNIGGASDIMTP
jgi:HD-GYP domain-containing protein (c-di-GMP phosphodiesterase class II)